MTEKIPNRLPNISSLMSFVSVARLGTFKEAADELSIEAGTLKARIDNLERKLGILLFDRGGRKLELTIQGRDYLDQIKEPLKVLSSISLHDTAGQRTKRLQISTPPTFARQVLVPALPSYSRNNSDVELELIVSIPYADDVGASIKPHATIRFCDDAALNARALTNERVLPVVSPCLIEQRGHPESPREIVERYPFLRSPLEPWAPWFLAAGLEGQPEPFPGTSFFDLGMILEAAACGQGVALARPSLAMSWLETGLLKPLFGISAAPQRQYHLETISSEASSTAGIDAEVGKFADWIETVCVDYQVKGMEIISAQT